MRWEPSSIYWLASFCMSPYRYSLSSRSPYLLEIFCQSGLWSPLSCVRSSQRFQSTLSSSGWISLSVRCSPPQLSQPDFISAFLLSVLPGSLSDSFASSSRPHPETASPPCLVWWQISASTARWWRLSVRGLQNRCAGLHSRQSRGNSSLHILLGTRTVDATACLSSLEISLVEAIREFYFLQ